ncbi:DUF2169 domain-containing protein [Cystobacter ferrugineus]|uniref:DUF2169 domain-containing protein n=1 Tax=Cystobacter ferrugineus TaxID=83449 RepID=UPI0024820D79|nr:DUF2169 domain-containing protein [Cystobacter ferrugineus]
MSWSGESWGKPGESSYKYEPEGAFIKPATDVALIGHAYAPRGILPRHWWPSRWER